jgi:chemotaxis protein methyltransferase CheR
VPGPLAGGPRELTRQEFDAFRALVRQHTGIALGPEKRQMLYARLARRLRALGLQTFTEYHRHLDERDPRGEELGRLINAVTTNKTDFFREPHHFRYLAERWVPELQARAARTGDRSARIWSAACSSGEEPYTIAVTLLEALGPGGGWDLRIIATDLDTDVLAQAENGIYPADRVRPVPQPLLARYFLRGQGQREGLVKVKPEVRGVITFRRLNFMEEPWPIRGPLDLIFCRNALIYFDRPTQRHILGGFLARLAGDGVLFLGHSESIHGLVDNLVHVGNTIYRRAGAQGQSTAR